MEEKYITIQESDIKPGDIVLKNVASNIPLVDNLVGKAIQIGQGVGAIVKFWQNVALDDVQWEHAAIVLNEEGKIAEAVRGGTESNFLEKNADYLVFRLKNNDQVIKTAVAFAEMALEQKKQAEENGDTILSYNYSGVLKAAVQLTTTQPNFQDSENYIDQLFPERAPDEQANGDSVFCSQFASLCYVIGAEQNGFDPGEFIDQKVEVLSPAQMVTLLKDHSSWECIGVRKRS